MLFYFIFQLRVLDASHNQIAIVDPELFEMPSLISLNLSHNQLSFLPKLKSNSCQLTRLDLSSNRFDQVPYQVVNFPCLSYLNLSFNKINQLPEWLASVKNLDDLRLEGVVLSNQDEKRDFQNTIQLLKLKLNNASRINEMKVVVTGPSKEGKAQFVSLFCDKEGQSVQKIDDGAIVKRRICKGEKSYNYTVWEIAGFDSESTVFLEKFLYTSFSTFIFVFDMKTAVCDISKLWVWLDAVAECASPSCILFFGYASSKVVGKTQPKLITDINDMLSPLVKNYSDDLVFGCPVFYPFSISSSHAESKMISDAVYHTAILLEWKDGQPYMGRLVHNSAVLFKERIDLLYREGKQSPVMTIESMEAVVSNLRTVEVHDPNDLMKISEYLNDIGSILSFSSLHAPHHLFSVCDINWFLLMMQSVFESIKAIHNFTVSSSTVVMEDTILEQLVSLPGVSNALETSSKLVAHNDLNVEIFAKSLMSILIDFKVLLPLATDKLKCLVPSNAVYSPTKHVADLIPNTDLNTKWRYSPHHFLGWRTWTNIIGNISKQVLNDNNISFELYRDAFVIKEQNLIISFSKTSRSIFLLCSHFSHFFKQIKRIVADSMPKLTSVNVICPKCLQENETEPNEIPFVKCLEAMLNSQEYVQCQHSAISESHRVPLVNVIPHLLIYPNLSAVLETQLSSKSFTLYDCNAPRTVRRPSETICRASIELKTEADFERVHDKNLLLHDFNFPCISSSEGILLDVTLQKSKYDTSTHKSEACIKYLAPLVGRFSEISSETFIPHVLVLRMAIQLARAVKEAPSLSKKLEHFLIWSLDLEAAFFCSLAVESVHDGNLISDKKRVDCWKFYMTKLMELAKCAAYKASNQTFIAVYTALEHIVDSCNAENPPTLESIIASLSPVGSQLLSRLFSLSDGLFCVTGSYSVPRHVATELYSSENDGEMQHAEVWLPQHDSTKMQMKLSILKLNSMAIKSYPIHSLKPKKVLAVNVCHEYIWMSSLLNDDLSCLSIIEIQSRTIVHNIKMKRNAVTCFAESKEAARMYMGTQAGFLFDFTSDVEAIRTCNPKPKHNLIAECEIVSLAIVGKFLWVSTGTMIYQLACSWELGAPKVKEFWLTEIKSGLTFYNLSVSQNSNVIYSFKCGGKCIWFLDPAVHEYSETLAYYNDPQNYLDISKVMERIGPSMSESVVAVTSVTLVIDCLWVGLASGHILVFYEGELIFHMQPYCKPVRSLCAVANEINGMQEFYVLSCGKEVVLPELLHSLVMKREDDVFILWHAPSKKVLSQMVLLEKSCGHYLNSYSSLANVINLGGFNDEVPIVMLDKNSPSSQKALPTSTMVFEEPKRSSIETQRDEDVPIWGSLHVKISSDEMLVLDFSNKPSFNELANKIKLVSQSELPSPLQLGYSLGQHELLVSVSSDEEFDSYLEFTTSNRPPLILI